MWLENHSLRLLIILIRYLSRSQEQRWDYTSTDTVSMDQGEQREDEIRKVFGIYKAGQ